MKMGRRAVAWNRAEPCAKTLPLSGYEPEYQSVRGCFSNPQWQSPWGAVRAARMNASERVKLSEAAPRCRPKKTTGVVYPRSAGIGIHKQGMTVWLIVERQDGSRPQVGDPIGKGLGNCASG